MAGTWVRVGVVTVTNGSKKITGFGTAWLSNLLQKVGKGCMCVIDNVISEVDYVNSDTELYLVEAWAGATASGKSYKISVTITDTIPELSSRISQSLAYANSQYGNLESWTTSQADAVTLTSPAGIQVTVPSLGNVLSKSGNLAGLADKQAARTNLGLGESATKSIGSSAGTVAAGDHEHTHIIDIGGDVNVFYPVLFNGAALRGMAISRYVHQDGTWMGSLRLHINGIGSSWGGDRSYLDYTFSQQWGGGITSGCLADISGASGSDGVFVWLRGGRTYSVSGVGLVATVYIAGVTEPDGSRREPMQSGQLCQLNNASSLTGALLYVGSPANNKQFWNGENLPAISGTWTPYVDDPSLNLSFPNGVATWKRTGNIYNIICHLTITGTGSASGGRFVIRGLPFNFGVQFRATALYESSLLSGAPIKSSPVYGAVTGSDVQFFYKDPAGQSFPLMQEHVHPNANGQIELIMNISIIYGDLV